MESASHFALVKQELNFFLGGTTFSGLVVWIPGILLWKGLLLPLGIPNHQLIPLSNH